jgi:hypothetical protein
MLLALLMLVLGLLGGPPGGAPVPLMPETERAIRGGGALERPSMEGAVLRPGVDRGMPAAGGGTLVRPPGGGGVPIGGGGVPAGPARGGGGVAVLGSGFSAPGFLLTHRLRSGSYTKLLASPSLALIGLFGALSARLASPFLPPNQPPKPQPFFTACWAAARCAETC